MARKLLVRIPAPFRRSVLPSRVTVSGTFTPARSSAEAGRAARRSAAARLRMWTSGKMATHDRMPRHEEPDPLPDLRDPATAGARPDHRGGGRPGPGLGDPGRDGPGVGDAHHRGRLRER